VQTDLRVLIYAGIESVAAVKFVQAMSRNHYYKRLKFGQVKTAKAKDPVTQKTVYEVIYVDIVDDLEKNGRSISQTVNLPDNINSKVLISYDSIKIDSDIPFDIHTKFFEIKEEDLVAELAFDKFTVSLEKK
jgi:hypothetical protein